MEVLQDLNLKKDPDLLVGAELSDDAGIYRLTDEIALVQTLDFFTPIVNDPFDFGRIAAANALSDVYAMGGRPLTAMNIVCFPIRDLDKTIIRSILRGGLEVIHEANATMVGGHSVEDPELKYGLSVTGVVHPEAFLTNAGAKPGDLLVLTKPLGTGILATALKAGQLNEKSTRELTRLMTTLNRSAAEAAVEIGANACTDITGFGLLGHCLELARASRVGLKIDTGKVPIIADTLTFCSIGLVPGGSYINQKFCSAELKIDPSVDPILLDVLFDPQTSGGLLISVPRNKVAALVQKLIENKTPSAAVIGEVVKALPGTICCG
jgi:selenide,water dikinase